MQATGKKVLPEVEFRDLGKMDFKAAWDYQEALLESIVAVKRQNRKRPTEAQTPTHNYLLFCEHPPVMTLGKSGNPQHLLLSIELLKRKNIAFYKINRGGDITHHGPGQIVGYPVLDLDNFFTDVHKYLRLLEEMIIRTLGEYGVQGDRMPGATGVWLDPGQPAKARKICAMGIRCSRWVTMHGFAFNINNDLDFFKYIIPCGITDKQVTSLHRELGREVDIKEVKAHLKRHFAELFNARLVEQ